MNNHLPDIRNAIDDYFSDMDERPSLQYRVLAQTRGEIKVKNRLSVGMVLVIILLCLAITSLAWSVYQSYFSDVAKLTLQSGDYEDWTLKEKRSMIQIMKENGFVDMKTEKALLSGSEKEIDAFMLERYAPADSSGDLSTISLMRIAWVEMGPYTDWSNETWVWFTDLMFEVGLWTESNDVDVYATPGDEAISPAEAIALAKQHLLNDGISEKELEQCQVIWHYMTHASDVARTDLKYLITFRNKSQSERYVWVTPDGQVL